jgi:hemerythrin
MIAKKELFPWKPEYNTNHGGIDSQHKRLAAICNKLYAGMSAGQGRAMVGPVLTELVEYTKTHFAFEEREMDRVGYPVAAQHKELHRKLVKQVSEMANQWKDSEAISVVEVAEFLKNWLIQHIGENDRPLATHLSKKGQGTAVAV